MANIATRKASVRMYNGCDCPYNLVCVLVLFGTTIPTSSFNFIQLFFMLITVPFLLPSGQLMSFATFPGPHFLCQLLKTRLERTNFAIVHDSPSIGAVPCIALFRKVEDGESSDKVLSWRAASE